MEPHASVCALPSAMTTHLCLVGAIMRRTRNPVKRDWRRQAPIYKTLERNAHVLSDLPFDRAQASEAVLRGPIRRATESIRPTVSRYPDRAGQSSGGMEVEAESVADQAEARAGELATTIVFLPALFA